jgi:hypothetical protein
MSAFGNYTCEFCGVSYLDAYPNNEEHVCKIQDLRDMINKLFAEIDYLQEQLNLERKKNHALSSN